MEASLALPVFLVAVLLLLKTVDLYRLHGMLTVSLQESARYLSICAYAVDAAGKESYEIPETAAPRGRTEEEGAAETVRTEVRTWEGWAVTGESVRALSERCERDARRYDGGFPLY